MFEHPIASPLFFLGLRGRGRLALAIYHRVSARRHRLPSWNDLVAD
jgi:hypothetical protein